MPQSLTRLLVHLIFSTAGREPFLRADALRDEMHHYLGGCVNQHGGQSLSVGGVADHVHMLLVLPKTMPIADLVRDLKRASSHWMNEREPGLDGFAWQKGYGAFSVGQTEIETVLKYIHSQEEHHSTRTFQEEYRAFLTKYGVEYDERYVWD